MKDELIRGAEYSTEIVFCLLPPDAKANSNSSNRMRRVEMREELKRKTVKGKGSE